MSTSLRDSLLRGILVVAGLVATSASAATADDADPRRPGAIKTTEVPAIPPEVFDRLNQYQNVRAAAFLGWSPDGKGLLIGTRFGNTSQLHRVYEPGGRREQITFFEEPAGGTFIPEAKDGALLVTMSQGGNENTQVYLLDRTTGRTTLLTDGKSKNDLGPLKDDGTQMIVHSNRRNGRDTDIFIADTRKPDTHKVLLETKNEFWRAIDWSADGKTLALIRYVSINESYPALLDIASKKLTPIPIPADGKVSYGTLKFSADGKSLFATCDARGEYQQLARIDRDGFKYRWLVEKIDWDIDELEVNEVTGGVAFTVNEDGQSRLMLLGGGVGDDDPPRAIDLPLGIVAGMEFTDDGKQLGFTLARPDAPADAYSIDVASGNLTRWSHSEVGGLNPETFVTPSRIQFPSFDSQMIPAYYYKPKSATTTKPAAVLINIHGGPEGQSRPNFSGITQYTLNEMGIAVIYPNVRGSAGYGKTYLKLDNAELREDSVRDIGSLLDWIVQQPELDEARVAVTGGSYGGYMVLASLVNFPDRIRAGVDIVGIGNFITFLERTSPYRQELRRAEYGNETDPKMRAAFERINPAGRVDKIKSALLVAHGTNDPRVPFFEAEQIADRVKKAGRPVWTVYADNEGHGFAKKDNRDYLTAVEVLFLQEFLK